MKKIKSLGLNLFFALTLVLGASGLALADSDLDFTLVNKTGYDIKKIFIAPSSQDEWSEEDRVKLPGSIRDGNSVDVTFNSKASANKWDLKIVWVDGGDSVEWHSFNLTKISKITLFYNNKTEETTAETE